MLSLFLAWHIVWFTRVTLSLILLLVIIRRQLYKPFPLFTLHTAWIVLAGMGLVAMNYAPSVNGYQYFVGVAISNSVEAILAFAIIYQMFTQRLRHYPVVSDLGRSAFRITTLIFVVIAVSLAWFEPGQAPSQLTSAYLIMQRTARTLQCGQLVFLFLFCGYFRLSWRSQAFGIALGFGILTSTSLATNAIHSQIASGRAANLNEHALQMVNDSTYLIAVLVWLIYILAPEQTPQPKDRPTMDGPFSGHDLEPWNRELERLLES
ncbi:membrane hypothetical protein [Candidatus Sulfotelmatobacter sp. SbA7]|jgi:hypothetical protein|nr:membrane hypothetical protein [Candidatus Sulfotelmatobacter sp. SbA7]